MKDYWGIPVARLSGDKHPHTIEIGNAMAEKAEAWLKAAGRRPDLAEDCRARAPAAASTRPAPAAWATTRKTSVVDTDCRVHDADNVYVIDGSVHVTNGGFNPVLTIMAIAYRAGEHIVNALEGAQFV